MKHTDTIDAGALTQARNNLAIFVTDAAEDRAQTLGFGWRPSCLAPTNYPDLQREFRASSISAAPYRVCAGHADRTIYGPPAANYAFRFWHDTRHAVAELTFDAQDEMALAADHLESLRAAGFRAGSLEHRLFHADTMGQAYFGAVTGAFVGDQLRFAVNAVERGLGDAVAIEARAIGVPLRAQPR